MFPVLAENLGPFAQGYATTILLTVASMAVALVIGTLGASLRVWGGGGASAVAGFYVEFIRNTPLLVQLFFYATLFAPANLNVTRNPVIVAIIGLSVYTGAFVAEVVRAGILSVDARQIEAARSLGLSQVQALRLVVLPQAIRTVVPPLGSITSALVRNSSIASAISARELLFVGLLIHQRTFSFEPFLGILVGYWSLTIPLAVAINALERRLRYDR